MKTRCFRSRQSTTSAKEAPTLLPLPLRCRCPANDDATDTAADMADATAAMVAEQELLLSRSGGRWRFP